MRVPLLLILASLVLFAASGGAGLTANNEIPESSVDHIAQPWDP